MNSFMPIHKEIEKGLIQLSSNDKCLARIIEIVGKCTLRPQLNHFEALVEIIISQQLSTKAAASIYSKFCQYFHNVFDPRIIIETDDGILRSLGLSNAKIKYVKDLSIRIQDGDINLNKIAKKSEDLIISELTKVKGIGTWSVQMFLIFNLCKLNVLPVDDLGIRRAIMIDYGLKSLPDEKRIRKIAKLGKWEPYCTIASWYLWRSLEFKD